MALKHYFTKFLILFLFVISAQSVVAKGNTCIASEVKLFTAIPLWEAKQATTSISKTIPLSQNESNPEFIIEKIDEKEVLSESSSIEVHIQIGGKNAILIDKQLNQSNAALGIISPPPKY